MTESVSDLLHNVLGVGPQTQAQLVASLIGLTVVMALRFVAMRVVNRRVEDPRSLYRWRKGVSYATFVVAIFVVGRPWFPALRGISTFLGIVTAGLAVALKDPIVNLAGWFFILWRRPFQVGDRIQVGEHAGDVIDVRIFQFSLMEIGNWVQADQSTGRVVHVPNGTVFQEEVANYSQGFQYIWDELPVLISFESNWEAAKALLLEIGGRYATHLGAAAEQRLRKAAQKYMIFYSKLTPTVYTSVRDSGVLLTIRYLCEPRRRRITQEEIWEAILRVFAERADIDFAYPTQRFYSNPAEGKAGTRPAAQPGGSPEPDGAAS